MNNVRNHYIFFKCTEKRVMVLAESEEKEDKEVLNIDNFMINNVAHE